MNTKTTLTVVTVALVLGVLFLIFETDLFDRRLPSERQGDGPTAPAATGTGEAIAALEKVKAEDIHRVRVEREGEPAFVAERDGKGWTQVEPLKFPLQPFEIDRLVSDATTLRSTSRFKPSQKKLSLKDLGLAPPRAKLTLESKDGKPVTLSLGKRTAAQTAYAAVGEPSDSADVYVVADPLHAALLDKDFKDWRSKSLATFSPGSVRSITLDREGDTIVLTQSEGRWAVEQPFTGRADRNAASQLALAPTSASIRDFVQDNPQSLGAFGLDEPEISMTIEVAEPPAPATTDKPEGAKPAEPKTTRHTLTIGNPQSLNADGYFAMWDSSPVVFTLAKTDVDKLRKPAADLRDPSLTPIARADLRSIKVERPAQPPLALTREEGHWKWADPAPPFALAGEQVDQLVAAIFDTKAREFIPLDAAKLSAPTATVTMTVIGGDQEEKLTVHGGEGDKLTVVRGNESTGHVVDKAALGPLFESPLAYRDRTVLDIQQDNVTEVHILRTGEHPAEHTVQRAEDGQWQLDGLDRETFQALLDRVAPLLASEWLHEPPVTTPEGVSIELTMKDGAKQKIFIHPESRAARVDGMPEAFKVEPDLAAAATAELRDRVVLRIEGDAIDSVKLDTAVIVRDSQGKYQVDGADLAEQEAAAIYDSLAGLTAERYLTADALPNLGDPAHTVTVQTRDDTTHKLSIWPPAETTGNRWIARVGDSKDLLVLSPSTASRLTAGEPPPREEAPEK